MRAVLPLFVLLSMPILAACAPDGGTATGTGGGDAALTGQGLYVVYCARCHGGSGRGDGVIVPMLDTPPSDLTQLAARNGGTYPAQDVISRIHGYPGQFDVMPEYGPLFADRTVTWRDPETGAAIKTPRALVDLSAYLSTIQAPAPG